MGTLKLSKFVHIFEKENIVCFYHSLLMETIYIESKYKDPILKLISNKRESNNDILNKIYIEMKEKGMIVCSNEDEELLSLIKKEAFKGVNIKVMVLHMTDFCNLKCKYCFIEGGMCDNYKRMIMSKETVKASIDKFIQIQNLSNNERCSIVFYGGEPLSNFETVKYALKYIDEKQEKLNFVIDKVIITNGTLINDNIAKELAEHNVLISLSLDGIKEVHDYNRIDYSNQGSFDKVINGLKILRNYNIEPSISCVMSQISIDHIDETLQFILGDLKIKGIGFNHVSIIPNLNYYNPEYENKYAKALIKVQEIIQQKYPDVYERRMGHKINCFIDKKIIRADCTGCGEQISVSPLGEIGICQGYMGTRKTFNNTVFDKNYFPNEDEVFIEWSNRSPLNNKKCLNCPALATCGGGCPRNADMINGDFREVDSAFCHFALDANEWLIWQNFEDQGYIKYE